MSVWLYHVRLLLSVSTLPACSRAYRDDDVLWVVEAKGKGSESEVAGLNASDHGHSSPRPVSVDGTHAVGTADFCLKPCSTGPIVEGQDPLGLLWCIAQYNGMHTHFTVVCSHCVHSVYRRVVILRSQISQCGIKSVICCCISLYSEQTLLREAIGYA